MDLSNVNFGPEKSMRQARDLLKYDFIKEKAKSVDGPIVEMVSYPNGKPGGFLWLSGTAFAAGDAPIGFDSTDMELGQPWLQNVKMAIWFFGPSRIQEPNTVYRWLFDVLDENASIYMTTEIPWRGKLPLESEYGQYSDEEIHATLVRSGFENIRHSVTGTYFKLWAATKSANENYRIFQRVEKHLAAGHWHVAVEELGVLDDVLDTMASVREYALLLAACHDLAGNTKESYNALSETLRIDPECARAMCGLGRLAALNDDLDAAVQFFESALKLSPCMVAALRGHAVICEALGDAEGAYRDMIDASNFRPIDEELLFEVIRLGNAIGAQDEVSEYLLERNGQHPGTQEAPEQSASPMAEQDVIEDEVRISS